MALLVREDAEIVRFVIELNPPSFCKSPLREIVSDLTSDEISESELLVKDFAVMLMSEFDRI